MRSAFLALTVTVVACIVLLAACFNKSSSSGPGFDGGFPDAVLPDVNLPDAGTARYTVGGNVTGLTGTGLVLEATASDFGVTAKQDVSVAPASGNGVVPFHFQTAVPSGTRYTIVVKTQPSNPSQNCKIVAGTGSVPRANVSDVAVNCSTNTFVISGTATGVEGAGLILDDNGGDPLAVTNGNFAFMKLLPSGSKYAVTVAKSPGFPSENCTVTQGSGTVTTLNVTTVKVNCIPNVFNVGGSVVGLTGTGLVLTDNGTDNVSIRSNGAFTFPSPVTSGSPFAATITTQPSNPSQACTIAAADGTVEDGDSLGILVNCTPNTFTVSFTVTGLAGDGLVLNTSAGSMTINANGGYALPTSLANGSSFSISVEIPPTNPSQSCSVTGGSGTISGANVSDAVVQCTTGAFSIGGQVSGLVSGSMVTLTDNGGDNVVVGTNGGFTFPTPLSSGSVYDVAATSFGQSCSVSSGGSGVVGAANVTNVVVQCLASGDFCANGQTDVNNCGFCGNACPGALICQGGACVCPSGGDAECRCANEQTDPNNCGSCGHACPGGQTCEMGVCTCTLPRANCNNVCVNEETDPNNCGRCGNTCTNGQTCQERTFTTTDSLVAAGPAFGCACPSPKSFCGEACVDETSDPNNCGACPHQCPSNLPVCSNSTCISGCPAATPTLCGPGQCIDTTTDSSNCGTCGNVCPEGLTCANSSCCPANQVVCGSACVDETVDGNCGGCGVNCSSFELSCALNSTTNQYSCCSGTDSVCNGTCTDTTSDVGNCGGCGPDPFSTVSIPSPFVCTGVAPACCGSTCSDTASDPNNCLGCGNVCPGDPAGLGSPACGANGCTITCPGEDSLCGGQCTDTSSDPNNCSSCADPPANVCDPTEDPNSFPTCVNGTCGSACNPGYTLCDDTGLCTATGTNPGDPNNCGACDNVCPTPQNGLAACSPGTSGTNTCGVSCNEGFTGCPGNVCVNVLTDNANCGGCDILCPEAQTCQGAQCQCPVEGQVLCNGACVDETSDSSNCGGCSNACPEGLTCQNSSCCPAGLSLCGGVCVNEQTDSQNCDGCGSACPSGTACFNGNCCGNGQRLCNSACVSVQSDPKNCGTCGAVCPTGVACQNGSCCASPQILCGPNAGPVNSFTSNVGQ